MKKFILVSIAFLLALLSMPTQILAQELPNWVHEMKKSTINYSLLTKEFNDYWKDKKKDASEFNRKFEEEEFVIDESYGWLRMYIRQYFELIKLRPQRNPNHLKSQDISQNRLLSQGQWTVAGPASAPEDIFSSWSGVPYGVGRINHLAFSGTNANVMYTVAPAGLFISKDTGHTWQSTQTDYMGYHSFRCVAVDPTNDSVIYLGYGDFNMSLGYIYDTGVMKSVDFGNSFTSLPNGMDSTVINSIQIDPNNNNNIIAGGINGIWKSTDAGLNWQHTYIMFDSLNAAHFIYDLKYKPNSSDTIYATTDIEFLISVDGGNSWNSGFSNFQFTNTLSKELLLGVTPFAPDYVYITSAQDFGNIYKSTDGGINFTATKLNQSPGLVGYDTLLGSYGQGAYDFTFYADPFDSLKLYIGSISVYSSNDGGITWNTPYKNWYEYASAHNLHPDQHCIIRNQLVPDILWVANDGGIYAKHDTSSEYTAMQNNLAVTMAFHFDADNFYDSTFAIGTQDNGASFTNDGSNFIAYKGGDVYGRIYCAYNNNAAIYTSNSNFLSGSSNIDLRNPPLSYPFNLPESGMQEPLSLTPVSPLTAFLANEDVWETNDMNGNPVNWRKIIDNTTGNTFVSASHSLADSNIFYVVRGDGILFRTFNALDIQPIFDSLPLPTNYITSMTTVANNPNALYLCGDRVFFSNDQGVTWTDITNPLNPLFSFQEIVADPYALDGSVYLLATNKVYYKNDVLNWIEFSNQLPDVTYINDISVKKYNSQERKVWVSIYGRSIWSSPVYQTIVATTEETIIPENEITIFPVPASNSITVESNSDNLKIEQIKIYTATGQQLSSSRNKMNTRKLNISISNLAAGIYFLEVITRNGISMKRLIVDK